MFIRTKYHGYNRHGEQSAAGDFLILLQPKTDSTKYPMMSATCADCGRDARAHEVSASIPVQNCDEHGIVAYLRNLSPAQREQVTDAELEESRHHKADCPKCMAYAQGMKDAGCRYFRPNSITYPIRAIVRYARLKQFGHFMMGSVRIGSHRVTLSGSYGSDGLPVSVPDEVYEMGTELPADLYNAWSHGGGWNSAGSEAPAMRQWALDTFKAKR